MASGIYNRFKANLMNKEIDIEGDTINLMLLTSSHSFDATNTVKADITGNEVTGTGYNAGGTALAATTVTESTTTTFDGVDVTWPSSTITARHGVIYDDTLTNDDLICSFDFGEDKSSNNGNFTVSFASTGIIRLT